MTGALETALNARIAAGGKCLVPYITGGYPGWVDAIRACAAQGADAVEIGLPFSDPVMDGPVIQAASQVALEGGTNYIKILHEVRTLDVGIPLVVMCYYNTVFHAGHERFASDLAAAGISAAIVPDLPLEESGDWCAAADAAGIETVMLAAPTAPDERLPRVVERARGFVYSVGLLGVTGERTSLALTATTMSVNITRGLGYLANTRHASGSVEGMVSCTRRGMRRARSSAMSSLVMGSILRGQAWGRGPGRPR